MDRSLRNLLNRLERTVNRHMVQEWRRHRIVEEETLARLFRTLAVDCVFDIGANVGGYGRMLRDYCGYDDRILSFEPTPDVFVQLRAAALNDRLWETYDCALGQDEGTAKFHVHSARMGSSFLPVTESDSQSPGNKIVHEMDVQVRNLNNLFPSLQKEFGFKRPFLKMDTQGFDLEVFSGACDVVESFVGLQSELSIAPFYEGAPSWRDSLKTYEQSGFALTAFVPCNPYTEVRLREIDCIMVRR